MPTADRAAESRRNAWSKVDLNVFPGACSPDCWRGLQRFTRLLETDMRPGAQPLGQQTEKSVPISPAKAGQEIGGKGGVSLVLLGVLHLTHTDSLSLTQTHILVMVSLMLAQIYLVSVRFIQICSFPLSLTQIHPISLRLGLTHSDPCNLTQNCSASCSFT